MQLDSPCWTDHSLLNLGAGDPLCLVHCRPSMRQPPDILDRHDEVAGGLEEFHCFIVGDAEETSTVDLQNLVSNLCRLGGWKEGRKEGGKEGK